MNKHKHLIRLLVVSALTLLPAGTLSARNFYWNYVSRGNSTAITSLGGSSAKFQASYPGATVRVDRCGTATLATLYVSGTGVVNPANPFTASTSGFYSFWTDSTCVKLTLSGGGLPTTITIDNVSVGSGSGSTVPVSVLDLGAACDGITIDTAKFQAAANLGATAPVSISIPASTCVIDDTITIANNGVKFVGSGSRSTVIKYLPIANSHPLFSIVGSSELFRNGIIGMSITSPDTTNTKIAIRVTDVGQPEIRDVVVGPIGGWTTTGSKTSIGLQIRGREEGIVTNVELAADIPISIEDDPAVTIDNDHWHFSNLNLIADGNPNIQVSTGVNLTNILFDGYQAWNKGTQGFYFNDTTTNQASEMAVFQNVRWEQSQSTAGYAINWLTNYKYRGVVVENCKTGTATANHGFRFVGPFTNITMIGNNFTGTTKVAYDISNTDQFVGINNFWNAGSTATKTNITCYAGFSQQAAGPAPIPTEFCYGNANANADGASISVVSQFPATATGTLVGANGASVTVPKLSGNPVRGRITATFSGGGDGVCEYGFTTAGIYLIGPAGSNCSVGIPGADHVGMVFNSQGNISFLNDYAGSINYALMVWYLF